MLRSLYFIPHTLKTTKEFCAKEGHRSYFYFRNRSPKEVFKEKSKPRVKLKYCNSLGRRKSGNGEVSEFGFPEKLIYR